MVETAVKIGGGVGCGGGSRQRMEEWMDRGMGWWMDGLVGGWVGGWMSGWVDGWVSGWVLCCSESTLGEETEVHRG